MFVEKERDIPLIYPPAPSPCNGEGEGGGR
jgi:hypothetical protein